MARRSEQDLPACYAMVIPGLEPIASEELSRVLKADIKRTMPGIVVFRVTEIDQRLLALRTIEDVFLLAWGSDDLTHRFADLKQIRAWTAREPNWPQLLQIHHRISAKPKGTPSYRLIAQMEGHHAYRRIDARDAMAEGLAGKLPRSWRVAEENAALEVWLRIEGTSAICGVRLSDRTMRHRVYKREHIAASLRPTLAAAMVQVAEPKPGQLFVDPCCGAGTILAELREADERTHVCGGDIDARALQAARSNLRRLGGAHLVRWDAGRLPMGDQCCDRIVSNPPFGKQIGRPHEIVPLYQALVRECDRALKPRGRAVFLAADPRELKAAASKVGWHQLRLFRIRILGQSATLIAFRKGQG